MAMSWELSHSAGGPAQELVTVAEHWYLTEDRCRVVKEGDPAGRWLWASPGTEVPRADAIRYGALNPDPEPEVAVAEEPEPDAAVNEPEAEKPREDEAPAEKKAPPAANKAAKKAPNKAEGK